MSWISLTTIQIPNTDSWQFSPPIPQSRFIRVSHQLSHPIYLQWYGLIAQSLDGSPMFLHGVKKLWPTLEGAIVHFDPLTEPDFLGGTRRIAVRGSKRQPYNLSWSVLLEFWSEITGVVNQFDIDRVSGSIDDLSNVLDLIRSDLDFVVGDPGGSSLTDPSLLPYLP